MIDWSRVEELRDEIGPEDFGEVVEIFLEEVDTAISFLGDASEPLQAQLHFLKGSSLNLGFRSFADLCQSGEARAPRGQTDIDIEEIKRCYSESKQVFLGELSTRFAA